MSAGACATTDGRGNYERGASTVVVAPDVQVCSDLSRLLAEQLAATGVFSVIRDRDVPHRFVARLASHQDVLTERHGSVVTTLQTVVHARTTLTVMEAGRTVASVETTGDAVDSAAYASDAARALVNRLLSQPPFGPQPAPANTQAARLTISEVGGTGSLDAGAVRAIVNRALGDINRCYAAHLSREPTLHGSLTVTFTVGDSGTVTTASASGVSLEREGDSCVLRIVHCLRFAPPEGGSVTYTSSFRIGQDR